MRRAVILIIVCAALPVRAADLTSVGLRKDGNAVAIDLVLSAATARDVALRPDGLVVVIRLPEVERIPALPILDPEPADLDAAFIERESGSKGARITLISSKPLTMGEVRPAEPTGPLTIVLPLKTAAVVAIAPPPPPKKATPAKTEAPPKSEGAPLPPHGLSAGSALVRAALKGDQAAQNQLAVRCLSDNPPDPGLARRWFEMAASRGNTVAAYNLAQLARRGIGGETDLPAARKWYRVAAEQGLAPAQFNLALMLSKEPGNPSPEIRQWFEAAARQNFAPAVEALKLMDAGKTATAPN